jgi:hypothetical protein
MAFADESLYFFSFENVLKMLSIEDEYVDSICSLILPDHVHEIRHIMENVGTAFFSAQAKKLSLKSY